MTQPNILFIFPDQWRSDAMGCAGHPVVRTPYLDFMASKGIRYTNAYSPVPSCIATRASLATGMNQNKHGRLGYRDGVDWTYEHTMMRHLRDGGYQTMLTGKTHFHPQRTMCGFEKMALYSGLTEPGFESDYHRWLSEKSDGLVRDTSLEMSSNSWLTRPWTASESLHPNTWTTDTAIDMIKDRDPLRPFFLQVGYHRPHPPLDPPIAWYNKLENAQLPEVPIGDWAAEYANEVTDPFIYDFGQLPADVLDDARRAYFAQIMHLDDQIGRLLNHMRRNGLMQNTWVVFMSDHGELLGDHHGWRKQMPFESSAGVPLVVMPPMHGEYHDLCNTIDERPLTHADIMPTFLEIAGLKIPECVDGKDILGDASHEFIHGEHAPCWQFVTDGKEKFAWQSTTGKRWFFDLQNDPTELKNLVNDPSLAQRVKLWEDRLIAILQTRPEDGQVKDGKLVDGTSTPPVRDFLLKK